MMVTEREREMTEYEFLTWFASKDLDRMDQAGAYLAFVEAEQPGRLDPDV